MGLCCVPNTNVINTKNMKSSLGSTCSGLAHVGFMGVALGQGGFALGTQVFLYINILVSATLNTRVRGQAKCEPPMGAVSRCNGI